MKHAHIFLRNIYEKTGRPIGRTTVRRLGIAMALFLVLTTIFAYIAREVVEGETLQSDRSILLRLNHFATPELDKLVVGITSLGDVISVLTITAGILIILACRKKWQAFTQVAFGIAGAGLLNFTLKLIFERNRPQLWEWIIHESSYSFPSGHAMLTGALAFTVIVLAWHTRYRYAAIAGGTAYIMLIGFSRLYLGVHYPTDILAGWCVSLAWVLAVGTILGAVHWKGLLK